MTEGEKPQNFFSCTARLERQGELLSEQLFALKSLATGVSLIHKSYISCGGLGNGESLTFPPPQQIVKDSPLNLYAPQWLHI